MDVNTSEDSARRMTFLRGLVARGLKGVGWEDADDIRPASQLVVQSLLRIVRPHLGSAQTRMFGIVLE
jgi:hypothetical protein